MHLTWAQRAAELCSHGNVMHYGGFLVILLVAFFAGEASPHRMLALFSGVIIVLLTLGVLTVGQTAQWAILGIGLFCSVMWSNIFSLAIEGLGPLKSQASSLLVMAILGGAVLPPIQGAVADRFGHTVLFCRADGRLCVYRLLWPVRLSCRQVPDAGCGRVTRHGGLRAG